MKKNKKDGFIRLETFLVMVTLITAAIATYIFSEDPDIQERREVQVFVSSNKNKKGAHLLQTKEHTYVFVSAGEIVDKKAFNVSVNPPVYNDNKTTATITYQLIPFEASSDQKNNEPDFTFLKLKKLDSATTTEINENIVEKSEK